MANNLAALTITALNVSFTLSFPISFTVAIPARIGLRRRNWEVNNLVATNSPELIITHFRVFIYYEAMATRLYTKKFLYKLKDFDQSAANDVRTLNSFPNIQKVKKDPYWRPYWNHSNGMIDYGADLLDLSEDAPETAPRRNWQVNGSILLE